MTKILCKQEVVPADSCKFERKKLIENSIGVFRVSSLGTFEDADSYTG
jgi:hypothetical protein